MLYHRINLDSLLQVCLLRTLEANLKILGTKGLPIKQSFDSAVGSISLCQKQQKCLCKLTPPPFNCCIIYATNQVTNKMHVLLWKTFPCDPEMINARICFYRQATRLRQSETDMEQLLSYLSRNPSVSP